MDKLKTDCPLPGSQSEMQVFNLESLISQTEGEGGGKSRDRSVFTLSRSPGLHVTLIAMHAGTMKPWHTVECPISIQVLRGSLDFITEARTVALIQGDILTLNEGIRHHMRATEEAVILLSLGTRLSGSSRLMRDAG